MAALKPSKASIATAKSSLTGVPHGTPEATPVLATLLETKGVSLRERGIDEAQTAELRARLAACAEDWHRPEMGAYDS